MVNNPVAMKSFLQIFAAPSLVSLCFGLDSGTNRSLIRVTNVEQRFDRSHNPNTDTHSQVLTLDVRLYTTCAPCS